MQFYGLSDIGKKRSENQDKIYFDDSENDLKLFIIADGMGGANAGSVASSMAVNFIKDYILRKLKDIPAERELIEDLIKVAMFEANNFVYEESKKNKEYAGMGTTVITVITHKNKVYIGHIGDSRAYRIRKNIIRQLTKDQSYVQALVDNGSITKEEAINHPQRNVLLKVLGCERDVEPDIITKGFLKDDILLLCTDGLTNMVDTDVIYDMATEKKDNIKLACESLVDEANKNGGYDNISVILICK